MSASDKRANDKNDCTILKIRDFVFDSELRLRFCCREKSGSFHPDKILIIYDYWLSLEGAAVTSHCTRVHYYVVRLCRLCHYYRLLSFKRLSHLICLQRVLCSSIRWCASLWNLLVVTHYRTQFRFGALHSEGLIRITAHIDLENQISFRRITLDDIIWQDDGHCQSIRAARCTPITKCPINVKYGSDICIGPILFRQMSLCCSMCCELNPPFPASISKSFLLFLLFVWHLIQCIPVHLFRFRLYCCSKCRMCGVPARCLHPASQSTPCIDKTMKEPGNVYCRLSLIHSIRYAIAIARTALKPTNKNRIWPSHHNRSVPCAQ